MRQIPSTWFALAGLLGIAGSLAFSHRAKSGLRVAAAAAAGPIAAASPSALPPALMSQPSLDFRFAELPAVRFSNQNTGQSAAVRLYDVSGHVDAAEAARLDNLLGDARDAKNVATLLLDRRTLQLAVRAALHFHAAEVRVVSAYRKPGRRAEGPHASGRAIDFKLPGVAPRLLAAYLRTLPRVGVGIYTHPKTSFVHLDDRERSFHWLDASPPGRHWREMSLGGAGLAKRDAAYARDNDWPEGLSAPATGE